MIEFKLIPVLIFVISGTVVIWFAIWTYRGSKPYGEKKKLKLDPDHAVVIHNFAKKFDMTQEQVAYQLIEQAFVSLRMLVDTDEKIIEGMRLYQETQEMREIAHYFYVTWHEGCELIAEDNPEYTAPPRIEFDSDHRPIHKDDQPTK